MGLDYPDPDIVEIIINDYKVRYETTRIQSKVIVPYQFCRERRWRRKKARERRERRELGSDGSDGDILELLLPQQEASTTATTRRIK